MIRKRCPFVGDFAWKRKLEKKGPRRHEKGKNQSRGGL